MLDPGKVTNAMRGGAGLAVLPVFLHVLLCAALGFVCLVHVCVVDIFRLQYLPVLFVEFVTLFPMANDTHPSLISSCYNSFNARETYILALSDAAAAKRASCLWTSCCGTQLFCNSLILVLNAFPASAALSAAAL